MTRKKQLSQTARELGFARRRSRSTMRSLVPRNNHGCAGLGEGRFVPSSPLPPPSPSPRPVPPSLRPASSPRRRPGSWCLQRGKGEGGSDFVPGASSAHPSHHFASRREARMRMGVGEASLFSLSHSLSSAVWEGRVDCRRDDVTSLRAAPISH